MKETEIKDIIEKQGRFFRTGVTLDADYRIKALRRLKAGIQKGESAIHEALKKDLGKSNFESYMCETGMVLSEITYMEKHVRSFVRERTVYTPLAQFHSRSYQKPYPYGQVLIMSPWNYPFLQTKTPSIVSLVASA